MISFPSLYFNTNIDSLSYTQYNYDHDFSRVNIYECVCPKCGARGFFHIHAKYTRYLSDSDEPLMITRIMCEKCHSTHAMLPDIIIPYRYFSSPYILKLFSLRLKGHVSISQISNILKLSIQCTSALISYFEDNYESLLYIANPYLNNPLDQEFAHNFFNCFRRFFMQNKRINIKHNFYFPLFT